MGRFASDTKEGILREFIRRLEGDAVERVKVVNGRIMGISRDEHGNRLFFILNLEANYGFTGLYQGDAGLREMAGQDYVPYFSFPMDVGEWLGEDPADIYQTEQVRRRLVQAP